MTITHSLPVSTTRLSTLELFLDVGQIAFRRRPIADGLYEAEVLIGIEEEEKIRDEIWGRLVH